MQKLARHRGASQPLLCRMWSTSFASSGAFGPPAAVVPFERRTVALTTGLQMEWLSQPTTSAAGHPVLFVHGTFHGAWCWAEVRALTPDP